MDRISQVCNHDEAIIEKSLEGRTFKLCTVLGYDLSIQDRQDKKEIKINERILYSHSSMIDNLYDKFNRIQKKARANQDQDDDPPYGFNKRELKVIQKTELEEYSLKVEQLIDAFIENNQDEVEFGEDKQLRAVELDKRHSDGMIIRKKRLKNILE